MGYTYWGGQNPNIDYSYWGYHPGRGWMTISHGYASVGVSHAPVSSGGVHGGFSWPEGSINWTGHFNTHAHRLLRDYNYAVFCPEGYVSEQDIKKLECELHGLAGKSLLRMLSLMMKKDYVYEYVGRKYDPILTSEIKDKVRSYEVKNIFTDLSGWQMFKPTKGVDKNAVFYKATYLDNDWFAISAPHTDDSVYVKVNYAGLWFNPIVVGVKNKNMGIDVCGTDYDTRYNKKKLVFEPRDDLQGLYMFMEFLCPIVRKEFGRNKLVSKDDFSKYITKVVAKEKAFVHEFYDKLRSSGNDMRKIQKKYHYQMVQRFAAMVEERIKNKSYGVDLFLPCNFDEFAAKGYEVEYMGEDCFKVTACGNSLYLKVVLYGNKLTPAIMGMINSSQDIDYCPDRFPWSKSVKE